MTKLFFMDVKTPLNLKNLEIVEFSIISALTSRDLVFLYTPPISEILCVKNRRAIVVCGFLMK
jgi:hypothetical protein